MASELHLGDSNWKFFQVGYPVDTPTASFIFLGFEVMFIRLQIRARRDERTKVCTGKVCKVYGRQQSPKRFRCRFSSRTETISAATVNRRPGESTSCAVSRIGGEADWFWCRQPTCRLLLPPHGTKCHTRAVHRVTKACAASVEFSVKRVQLWSWFSWLQEWFEIITLPFGFFFFFFLACWDSLVFCQRACQLVWLKSD